MSNASMVGILYSYMKCLSNSFGVMYILSTFNLINETMCGVIELGYSLDVNLIPRSPTHACQNTRQYRKLLGTCGCEEHCSWDVCRLEEPPNDCLHGTKSIWKWDHLKNAWVAQLLEGKAVY